MRLSFDSPFVSYPAQALFAGGAVSIACLLYQRAAKAFESDKVSDNDISHVLKGLTVVVLSSAAATSAHFLGASFYKSGSLGATVSVSLIIFEQFREKGVPSPSGSPPNTPSSKQETPAASPPATPPSPKQVTPTDHASPVSVKALVKQLEAPKSKHKAVPCVPPKPAPSFSFIIETEETTVEHPEATSLPLPEDDNFDFGDPQPLAPVESMEGPVDENQDPTHQALTTILHRLNFGKDEVDGEEEGWEETSQCTEVESSATVESTTETTPPSPTQFEKICAEVTKTENIFVTNLRLYQDNLNSLEERMHPEEIALKGLEELIQVSEDFLAADIPQVYLNLPLMTRYINALEVMTKNYLSKYEKDAIFPVQRGPRHELFLKDLAKIDPKYQVALDHVQKLFSSINNAPKLAQLTSLTSTLENLLACEKKKQLNKIVKREAVDQFIPARYELVVRSKTLAAIDEKDQSIPSLHQILDFLLNLPDTIPEVVIQVPKCIALLENSKWWDKFSKKDKKGDIEEKTLKYKLQKIKDIYKK